MADYISYLVSGLVLFGGIFGYIKAGKITTKTLRLLLHNIRTFTIFILFFFTRKGSMMSLGSGVIFGGLIGYGAYRVSTNPKDFVFLLGKLLCHVQKLSCHFAKTAKKCSH